MKRMKKITILLLVMALVLSSLAACGNTPQEAGSDEPRTVVDMAGRTVTLPDEIDSIGTFGSIGVLNTFVELMGEGDKIINEMSPSFTKTDKWKYQYKFAPQLKGSPVFEDASREIQMETVLEVNPDLCLVMSKETVTLLEEQGLTVVYIEWNELEDVKECVTLLGEVLNKQDVADDYINYFEEMTAKAAELTKDIPEEDRQAVAYGSITEFTQPHAIAEWWIAEAGGISVTADGREDGSRVYTMEDLLMWNPDVMVTASPEKEDILANGTLKDITAVKEDKIYQIPTVAHVWGNRTPEQPLTIMWMMNKLYPEIMTYEDLAADIEYFYGHFFGYKMSSDEIEEIINYQ